MSETAWIEPETAKDAMTMLVALTAKLGWVVAAPQPLDGDKTATLPGLIVGTEMFVTAVTEVLGLEESKDATSK